MDAIITPEAIYVISILKNIDRITFVIMALSFSITVVGLITLFSDYESRKEAQKYENCTKHLPIIDAEIARCKKTIKFAGGVTLVCALIKIFIPTEKEMYAIAIAPYITADNLEIIKGGIIDFVKAMR